MTRSSSRSSRVNATRGPASHRGPTSRSGNFCNQLPHERRGEMGQQLFSAHKIGLFCDQIVHGIEKRRGDDVKVITLTLRAQPFDAKLATALDDGVGEAGV